MNGRRLRSRCVVNAVRATRRPLIARPELRRRPIPRHRQLPSFVVVCRWRVPRRTATATTKPSAKEVAMMKLLSIQELAGYLGVPVNTPYQWRKGLRTGRPTSVNTSATASPM